MSRQSRDEYRNGKLINGYDYNFQCWVLGGIIQKCGHPASMDCGCTGREYAGREWDEIKKLEG